MICLRSTFMAPLAVLAALLGQPSTTAARPALPPVPGEVIVQFKPQAAMLRPQALAAPGGEGRLNAAAAQLFLASRSQALGAQLGRALTSGAAVGERTQVIRQAGANAAELARALSAHPDVAWAVPNGRQRRLTAPNDPLYGPATVTTRPNGPDSGQWYLRAPDSTLVSAMNIEPAWARTFGSPNIVVAVLDSGVRFEHPDLGTVASGGRFLPGYDFVSDVAVANDGSGRDADPSDPGDFTTAAENSNRNGKFFECDPSGTGEAVGSASSWHGTATGSLVGALTNNSLGMAGTAPGALVLPVRVLGKCFGDDGDIQAAMRWSAGIAVAGLPTNPSPAKVINLSLGSSGACTASYQSLIDELTARGVLVVAAAGNSAGEPVGTPANCRGVLAVAAVRHAGSKVGFSDLGPQIGIAAPGGNCVNVGAGEACLYPILAATNRGTQGPDLSASGSTWTDSFDISVGTSFASPLVAGVAALVWSARPELTPDQVRQVLQNASRRFPRSGATNGPNEPAVAACSAPRIGTEQLQCYCPNPGDAGYPLCGTGMVDAGAAVALAATGTSVLPVTAVITSSPSSPSVGDRVTFSSANSRPQAGAFISQYQWSLVDGGGVATAFEGSTTNPTASVDTSGAGTVVVSLTVVDNLGGTTTTEHSVQVDRANFPLPPLPGGSGGGSLSLGWMLGLAVVVAGLARARR